MRKKNAISYNDCPFSCQLSSLFLTLFSATKQKWKFAFCAYAKPFQGFDVLFLIFPSGNSMHYTLQFDAERVVICVRTHGHLMQITWWFDANTRAISVKSRCIINEITN